MTRFGLISVLVIAVVVMMFNAFNPHQANAQVIQCERIEDVLPRFKEHTAHSVSGVTFDMFVERIIAEFGAHPSGKVPDSGVVIQRPDDPYIYLILVFDGMACGQFFTRGAWKAEVLKLLGEGV